MLLLLGGLLAPVAQASSFNWASASCVGGGSCNTVGSITRFSNAVAGANPRDILLEVISTTNGATVYEAAVGTVGAGASYIDGKVGTNLAPGAVSQVRFRLRFVNPGTTTDNPLPGPVYFTSLDTDGMQSTVSGGYRERFEIITPTVNVVIGPQLESTTALNAGGVAYSPVVCANGTAVGCNDSNYGGTGNYVFYPLLSTTPNVAATAVYTGMVGNIDFAFGLEVAAVGPGSVREAFRQYGIAGGVPDADMVPTPIVCTPGTVAAGAPTSCALTCTNNGPDVAINPSCDFTGTLPVGAVRSAGCGTLTGLLASGSSRACSITFTPTVSGLLNLTGGTGALNDTNGGAVPTAGNNPSAGSVNVTVPTTADMSPVFSNLPALLSPGVTTSGLTLTCSNAAVGAAALAATCVPTASAGVVSAVNCAPASGSTVVAGASIACTFSYTAPGTAGGSDTVDTAVLFTGTTGATNDATAANNTTTASVPLIDALDETTTTPYGTAVSLAVLANDTRGVAAVTFGSVSLTVLAGPTPGSSIDPSSGAFSTTATTLPGTYTVTYQLCASPALTPAVCDTATATIVVGPGADMVPTFGALPGAVHPGQLYTGLTLNCTNVAGGTSAATARGTLCQPQASVGTVGNVVCAPLVGADVASGAVQACSFSYQAPGTQGGADEPTTAVTFTGTTGAANDLNGGVTTGGNNLVTAAAVVIDALDESTTRPGGATGQTTALDANDQIPLGSVYTPRVGGTCANASVSASGLATYDVPASGSCTVAYQVCAPAPNSTACDTATLTVTATGADMSATFSGLPTVVRPGQALTGLGLTCTNIATTGAATAASCAPTVSAGTVSAVVCSPAAGGSVAVGAAIACTFSYTAPGVQGGVDEPVLSVLFTGTTGAANDTNAANNVVQSPATVIDAVDDNVGQPGGTTGRTTPLAPNDQYPTGSTFAGTGGTCANASVGLAGLATYDVPASGNCTVTYQLCAPAPAQTTCDFATLTVTAGAADLSPTFGSLPRVVGPGQRYTGLTLTCTNAAGGAVATSPTCAPDASVGTIGDLVCTPAPGAELAAGAAIACTFAYTAPGSRGGADEPATAVVFRGQTGAVNDSNGGTSANGNNLTLASATLIDAVDDADAHPASLTGQTTNVADNDQFPTGSTFTRTGGTCAFASMGPTGLATYDMPASGACTVVYQVCAPAPDAASCDTATLTVTVNSSDMTPTFSGLPTVVRPGQSLSGLSLTCRNAVGLSAATGALCQPSASVGTVTNLQCAPATGGTVAAGTATVCTFGYTAPGAPGGSRETATSVVFTGTTGATNDSNGGLTTGGNNSVSSTAAMIDAVSDGPATVPSTGARVPLYGNDTLGGSAVGVAQVVPTLVDTSSLIGATLDAATGELVVPAGTAPGSYALTYQICAASSSAVCDQATVLVTVQGADMVPSFAGLPGAASPGSTVTGTLTCSNSGPTAATQATCAATGASVGACTVGGVAVTLPVASLPAGSAIVCALTATVPASGVVALTGLTGATNDTQGGTGPGGNNSTSASLPVIDAVNDGPATVPATGSTLDLLVNDTLGGAPVTPARLTVTLTNPGGLTGAAVDAQGRLTVPANTAPGAYTLTYQICVNPATTPVACDTATVTVNVLGQPDLQVSKTHSPATFTERHTGTYTITARNTGGFATSLPYTVVDTLPAGMAVAAVPTGIGWDCSPTVVGATSATCTSGVVVAAGASAAPITLVVNVAAGACATPDAGGLCSVAAGTALVNQVRVSGGGESGAGGTADNNTGTDPTPVQQAGAVTGRVWLDVNHDRAQNGGESGVSGMQAEVYLVIGGLEVLQGSAVTDALGDYRVDGLVPGSGYLVRFLDKVSGAYYGRPVSNDPAGGNDPTAATGTGVVTSGTIRNLTVPAGQRARINQSLPLDPSGIVYGTDTRVPVGGVRVELLDAAGAAVPASCLVGGATSVVTSAAGPLAGAYSFLLHNPVPTGCPGAATYQLRITPTSDYVVSRTLTAQAGTLTPPVGCTNGAAGGICTVQTQNAAPTGTESTAWYTSLRLDPAAGPDVVNNHIPLDPSVVPALLVIKTGDRAQVELGDSVRYTVVVKRSDSGRALLPALDVVDTLPAGFRYIDGTAQVNGVSVADPIGKPGPVLRFSLGAMASGSTVTLTYRVRVGVGALQGTGINSAQATGNPGATCGTTPNALCSNVSQFRVRVTGGVFAAEACVVGKVFVDCNNNHVQDDEELGIPGVRLYLTDGTSLISDVEGKYSVCGLAPRTQVMVVDQTTLPRGSRLTTTSSRNAGDAGSLFLDLKNGELHRADVVEGSCSNRVLEQVKARRARGETQAADTEKRGQVLRFDGKPVTAPAQATDSARQRGGTVRPRQPDSGSATGAAQ
ncbi:SdrD B-like domain-containing protein [Sphaerotilus sp.]|uniref:SdrD B-like domain-containing protein n=1 Tax=Sphaerotilus sp. TaxID=2093942 RepID=UPI00286DEF37|nr:SdrD B-like domain-containing protein [Sphaerotilus sp.]